MQKRFHKQCFIIEFKINKYIKQFRERVVNKKNISSQNKRLKQKLRLQ